MKRNSVQVHLYDNGNTVVVFVHGIAIHPAEATINTARKLALAINETSYGMTDYSNGIPSYKTVNV